MNTKKATLTKHIKLDDDVFELHFETEDPNFEHKAGQFVTIKIPQPAAAPLIMRSYSISSMPTPGKFELCVKLIEDGKGTNYLNLLKEGTQIEFLGPLGHFVFKTPENKSALFIGTGTGIAPLKAMIEDELSKNSTQKMHLIFGVRHIKDIFYKDIFETLATKHPNFTYDITLSRPESPEWEEQGGKTGRVTALLKTLDISPNSTEIYICGLKDMVLDVTESLQQKGLPKEAIYFERFN
jgi:ferredoxin-NADP reductase